MNNEQLQLAFHEAGNYKNSDPDAFVSDMITSTLFLPEDPEADLDLSFEEDLRKIWRIVNVPFREYLKDLALSQKECSQRFFIPYRTVQGWTLEERTCPVYIRIMMAMLSKYI